MSDRELMTADAVERILEVVSGPRESERLRRAPPIVPFLAGPLIRDTEEDEIPIDAQPADVGRVRACFATATGRGGRISTTLVRTVSPREVRGQVRRVHRTMFEATGAPHTAHPIRTLWGWVGDGPRLLSTGRVNDAARMGPSLEDGLADWAFAVRVALGLSWVQQFHWHADISLGDGPAVRLRTDPAGARALFRLRDVPEGKRRRPAIYNWVREHYRRRREGADHTLVRKHLRGRIRFDWSGYKVSITPPADAVRDALAYYGADSPKSLLAADVG